MASDSSIISYISDAMGHCTLTRSAAIDFNALEPLVAMQVSCREQQKLFARMSENYAKLLLNIGEDQGVGVERDRITELVCDVLGQALFGAFFKAMPYARSIFSKPDFQGKIFSTLTFWMFGVERQYVNALRTADNGKQLSERRTRVLRKLLKSEDKVSIPGLEIRGVVQARDAGIRLHRQTTKSPLLTSPFSSSSTGKRIPTASFLPNIGSPSTARDRRASVSAFNIALNKMGKNRRRSMEAEVQDLQDQLNAIRKGAALERDMKTKHKKQAESQTTTQTYGVPSVSQGPRFWETIYASGTGPEDDLSSIGTVDEEDPIMKILQSTTQVRSIVDRLKTMSESERPWFLSGKPAHFLDRGSDVSQQGRFQFYEWSPLIHRYKLLLGAENKANNVGMRWTVKREVPQSSVVVG